MYCFHLCFYQLQRRVMIVARLGLAFSPCCGTLLWAGGMQHQEPPRFITEGHFGDTFPRVILHHQSLNSLFN